MDGGKEWRIIRSAAGRAYDNTIIDPIMLRFRPIAPKPAGGGYVSGSPDMDYKNAFISRGRKKRKYVRVRKNNNNNSKNRRSKKTIIHEEDRCGSLDQGSVTLQLLPERSDRTGSLRLSDRDGTVAVDDLVPDQNDQAPLKNSSTDENCMGNKRGSDLTAEMRRKRVAESWVTVEGVTGACMDRDDQFNLGMTDEERMNNLECDTCPGFISDGSNTVQWVNGAFKRMVRDGGGQLPEVTVRFGVKGIRLPYLPSAFTCQVKLQYTWGNERCSKFVPCDVWRMDGGGFAWKLDVKAALTLGPNSN